MQTLKEVLSTIRKMIKDSAKVRIVKTNERDKDNWEYAIVAVEPEKYGVPNEPPDDSDFWIDATDSLEDSKKLIEEMGLTLVVDEK